MAKSSTQRNRERLARIRAHGGALRNFQLSAAALARLDALMTLHGCTGADVLEGLLLGTVPVASALDPMPVLTGAEKRSRQRWAVRERLSPSERDAARALGVAL
jgi:hypothetical protein